LGEVAHKVCAANDTKLDQISVLVREELRKVPKGHEPGGWKAHPTAAFHPIPTLTTVSQSDHYLFLIYFFRCGLETVSNGSVRPAGFLGRSLWVAWVARNCRSLIWAFCVFSLRASSTCFLVDFQFRGLADRPRGC